MNHPYIGDPIPDMIGEIVAWRTWTVTQTDDGPQLRSYDRTVWPTNKPLHAEHLGGSGLGMGMWQNPRPPCTPPPHKAPYAGCLCGIHGLADPDYLASSRSGSAGSESVLGRRIYHVRTTSWVALSVVGQVALSGEVYEHDKGWRAQRARPVAVARMWDIEPAWCRRLRDVYGLPLIESPEARLSYCLAHERDEFKYKRRKQAERG